jgi:hypothetical protein
MESITSLYDVISSPMAELKRAFKSITSGYTFSREQFGYSTFVYSRLGAGILPTTSPEQFLASTCSSTLRFVAPIRVVDLRQLASRSPAKLLLGMGGILRPPAQPVLRHQTSRFLLVLVPAQVTC